MSKRKIRLALKRVNEEIVGDMKGTQGREGFCARGLSREGYQGGYSDALSDVLLVLNGVQPNRRDYWTQTPEPR